MQTPLAYLATIDLVSLLQNPPTSMPPALCCPSIIILPLPAAMHGMRLTSQNDVMQGPPRTLS